MIRVQVAARSPAMRARLEAAIRSNGGFSPAAVASAAEVLLIAIPQLNEDQITTLGVHPIPVVVLADVPDAADLARALRTNIRAVLPADASQEEILAAVSAAAAGLIALEPSTLDSLAHARRAPAEVPDEPLTPREIEVLTMLADGLSNKLIAGRLGISEHTVKFHVTSVFSKMGVGTRTEAVTQGIRRGLILI